MTQPSFVPAEGDCQSSALYYFNGMIAFFPPFFWLCRKSRVYTVNLTLRYSLSCIFGVQNPQRAVKQSKIADILVYFYSIVLSFSLLSCQYFWGIWSGVTFCTISGDKLFISSATCLPSYVPPHLLIAMSYFERSNILGFNQQGGVVAQISPSRSFPFCMVRPFHFVAPSADTNHTSGTV